MNKLTTALLALTAMAIASTGAFAQVSVSNTDLILGFRITDGSGTGANTDLEIDLGSTSNFTSSSSFTLDQVTSSVLAATYGPDWATRADLTWGVAGVVNESSDVLDVTSSAGAQKTAANLVAQEGTVLQLSQGLANATAVVGNASAGTLGTSVDPASNNADSYVSLINPGTGNADYGFFTPSSVTEIDGGSGVTIGSDELYQYTPSRSGTGADLGTFTLDSDGTFNYTGVAAPEPSTYAMMFAGVGLLFFIVRLRRQSTLG